AEFARRIGVTPQYVLLLTGNAKARPENIKPALAKLIALEFDCDYEWLLHGKESELPETAKPNKRTCEGPLRSYGLSVKENETVLKYADSMTVKQIAGDTGVTVNTVNYYLRMAYKKLNVHSRKELAELLRGLDMKE
ncbi:MAG: helix-turn-helix domain-containing protein, partial [Clostridia bacterium]|nr:helix-turn-helix domain-containing protein [Clostridia bacterium]